MLISSTIGQIVQIHSTVSHTSHITTHTRHVNGPQTHKMTEFC